jgi:tetratricopeptide (TPR) repeat protein
LARVSAGDFARPRQVDPAVPVALEAVCLKAMALDPACRYATPRELGEDIERWLADEPVRAYPEPLPDRVMRWVRRRKQWVAAAAVMLILTVVGLAIHIRQITREKARTAEQLAKTREAVEELLMTSAALREFLHVSGENLAFVPNTEKLREHLARLILDRYQRLGDRFPSDPRVRLETAQVLRVIGGLGRITGQFAKAQESYDKAIELLTALCEQDAGHSEYRRVLTGVLTDRGELNHMNGRALEAENDLRAAIDQADKLESSTISPSSRQAKASALLNLSEVLELKGRHAEARTAANQAVDLLRPLAADEKSGSTSVDRWLLSLALTARGVASGEVGDRGRANQDFDEAAQVAGSVARDDDVYDDAQFQLACIANRRGELSRQDASRLAESARSYEAASGILARLISDHRQIPHYREEMAVTLCGWSAVHLATTHIAEAQRDCAAAQDHVASLIEEQAHRGAPENAEYLSLLGRVLARQSRIHFHQGRPAEGRKTQAEAEEKLSRAVQLDPARAADRARLERIKGDPTRWED